MDRVGLGSLDDGLEYFFFFSPGLYSLYSLSCIFWDTDIPSHGVEELGFRTKRDQFGFLEVGYRLEMKEAQAIPPARANDRR